MIGLLVFFYPLSIPTDQVTGLVVAIVGVLANSFSSVLGRSINRQGDIHPITVTVVSMGGATECSMDSTIYEIGAVAPAWNSIPYGEPMANQLAYVLDPDNQPTPIGVPSSPSPSPYGAQFSGGVLQPIVASLGNVPSPQFGKGATGGIPLRKLKVSDRMNAP